VLHIHLFKKSAYLVCVFYYSLPYKQNKHFGVRSTRNNLESQVKLTEGKDEREIAGIIMDKVKSLYGDDKLISNFFDFVKNQMKEVFFYHETMNVEKTSDLEEQHFSIISCLYKHRFKTKERVLRTSYWYHRYLSTEFDNVLK